MDGLFKDFRRQGLSPDMQRQMEATMKMLDQLAATDPQKYKEYVNEQMRMSQEEEAKTKSARTFELTPHFSVLTTCGRAKDVPIALSPRNAARRAPVEMARGHQLYLNVCSHAVLKPPVLPGEAEPTQVRPGDAPLAILYNLHVEMAVSPARQLPRDAAQGVGVGVGQEEEGEEGAALRAPAKSTPSWVVDVVVCPWIAQAAVLKPPFHQELCIFFAEAVCNELGVEVGAAPRAVKGGAAYVGGTGSGGATPLPFLREWAGAPTLPPTGAHAAGPSSAPSPSLPISSPSALLGAVRSGAGGGAAPHRPGGRGEEVAAGLEGLLSVGKALVPEVQAAGTSAGQVEPSPAEQLAEAFASTFPLSVQLHAGAADVHTTTRRVEAAGGGQGRRRSPSPCAC